MWIYNIHSQIEKSKVKPQFNSIHKTKSDSKIYVLTFIGILKKEILLQNLDFINLLVFFMIIKFLNKRSSLLNIWASCSYDLNLYNQDVNHIFQGNIDIDIDGG